MHLEFDCERLVGPKMMVVYSSSMKVCEPPDLILAYGELKKILAHISDYLSSIKITHDID